MYYYHSCAGISPSSDLYVREGSPVEMFCVLNTTNAPAEARPSDNLYFRINGKVATENVDQYNDTAIRLYINESKVLTGSDHYTVQCEWKNSTENEPTGVCMRYFYVGCEYCFCFLDAILRNAID